ncbi:MAG: hypothetical protein L6Q49_04795, partial [Anaerolineales bacterium]|nr:hypothetical protein [Anaerolineales bacterium]
MSMEDILKVLMDSRKQGSSAGQGSDPMADLIGGLLAGQPQMPGAGQQGGLGNMMGMLEMFMGGNQQGSMNQSMAGGDPLMMLLQPFVANLAKKMNIPPEIGMVVVSLVAHKLLAHHPTSGRDSNTFDLDDMLTQMGSGKINSNVLYQSGMINEVTRRTGMNEADAEKALNATLNMFGKSIGSGMKPARTSRSSGAASAGRSLKSTGIK